MNGVDLKHRTLELIGERPSPTRTALRWRTFLLMAAAASISLGIFSYAGGVRGSPRPQSLILATSLGAAAIAALAAWLAWGRGGSMLGRHRVVLSLMLLAVPVALFIWKIAASWSYPDMMVRWPERIGLRCLRWSLLMGLAPLAAIGFLRADSEPVAPVVVGAALGMAVGAATWVLVDLWCPVAFPPHLLIGHVLPTVLLCMAGALLGRFVLALRRK